MLCVLIADKMRRIKIKKIYTELIKLKTFNDRFNYLMLKGSVGIETFGHARHLNQMLYSSRKWKRVRDEVIIRDEGCDLGIFDREIFGKIVVHHINPITMEDIENEAYVIFDLENLICTTPRTHNAIHFGDESLLIKIPEERTKNDTIPWR